MGSLGEEKWVCSPCSGSCWVRWGRKKFVILVNGKVYWLGSVDLKIWKEQ